MLWALCPHHEKSEIFPISDASKYYTDLRLWVSVETSSPITQCVEEARLFSVNVLRLVNGLILNEYYMYTHRNAR